MNKKKLKESIFSIDKAIQIVLDKTSVTHAIYEHILLPMEAFCFKAGNYWISNEFRQSLAESKKKFFTEEELNNPKLTKQLEKTLVKVFIAHRMRTHEYFLYNLRGSTYWEQKEYLTDTDRRLMLDKVGNQEAYEELTNKSKFYAVTKKYFGREVCIIDKELPPDEFISFVSRHSKFIVKPMEGSTGKDAEILTASTPDEARQIYAELAEKDQWVAEELIKQHPAMAAWNESSVNTLRVPTITTKYGCKILQPFFRTGRKGSVIDNAGQGGIFAVFDPDTGVITTDGVDEYGGRFECHPDSGMRYKGWQIPHYDEMKRLVEEIMQTLPSQPRYAGLDLSLTEQGWILVEGNYDGQFVGQIAERKGIRKQFIKYYLEDQNK